ncbi:MAG: sigma-70 family RNA polymerase sigma factor [Rhodospirillales bacterium]
MRPDKNSGADKFDEAGSEEALLAGLRRGDNGAYEILIRRLGPRLLSTARRILGNEEAAKDCLQEAFINAFRSIDNYKGEARLGTWLHRITVNAALMRLRSQARRPELSLESLMPSFDENGCRVEPSWHFEKTPVDYVEDEQVRRHVISKIYELPENYRIVLLLRDIEEMPAKDVADVLNISENAVKTRLHRARSGLKKLLEPLWKEAMK